MTSPKEGGAALASCGGDHITYARLAQLPNSFIDSFKEEEKCSCPHRVEDGRVETYHWAPFTHAGMAELGRRARFRSWYP